MERKLIFTMAAVGLILIVSFISQTSAAILQTGTDIDIRHSVRTDGATTSTAYCNITVFDPKWLTLVKFKPMSYDALAQTYNYTLPASNVSEIGNYCYDVTCNDAGYNTTQSFCFDVTVSGTEFTTSDAIAYVLLLAVGIIFLILFIYGSIVIPFENIKNTDEEIVKIAWKKHIKIFMIAMSYLTFAFVTYVMWNFSQGFIQLYAAERFFYFIYTTILALTLPFIVVAFILFLIFFIKDLQIDKKLERGITIK